MPIGPSPDATAAEVRGGALQLQVSTGRAVYSALIALAHPVADLGRLKASAPCLR